MFSSLRVRDFRIYWFGMLVSLTGTWVQIVAQSWLVFRLTHSAFLLGVVGFLGSLPVFLFSLPAGVFADRLNKRSILLITQHSFMFLAFALAVLTHLQLIRVWHIMCIALLNGLVMAFDAPARQSVVPELVGTKNILNAVALNSAAFNSARVVGPALAGIFVASIGMSGCFYLNGLSFLAVIGALFFIRSAPPKNRKRKFFAQDLLAGLRFIRKSRVILILISLVGITSLFGISYVILMPLFADQVLRVGVKGLGVLMSSSGIGALAAALLLARLGDITYKGRLLFFALFVFSGSLMLFSLSRIYLLSIIALLFIGWSSVCAISLVNTLLQMLVPDELRGRVMSGFMFTFAGVMPFGNLLGGWLAQSWGVSLAVLSSGAACAVLFLLISLRYPELSRL